ncbi:MAG: Imidazoleglycerol-phosphate dehydratase [Promethearchaeota archaeon]|nr:MAG: Imidazoleglycerol-phosphate dehydratase [Candidatus Lokiarchaeota archaeon]
MSRKITLNRETKETQIELILDIDGIGNNSINTGIGLFDHLLEQVAIHGAFDLEIQAKGDLHIDAHHLIEDIGIVLGKAFKKALGDKKGIMRTANSYFPLDEALTRVVIDISGRPYLAMNVNWSTKFIGSKREFIIPVSLIEHFLYSFIINAGLTTHIHVLSGKDDHHIAESIFKGLGKSLDKATRINKKKRNQIPSSKGMIE